MKPVRTALAALLLPLCAAASDCTWRANLSSTEVHNLYLRHGESAELVAELYKGGVPYSPASAAALYQTNGMDMASWWSAPCSIASNILTVAWTPELDPGADRVSILLRLDGRDYPAAMLYLRPGPIHGPNVLPPPTQWLDFDAVAWTNAPWALAADLAADLAAAAAAATNYTDVAVAAAGADMTSVSNTVSDLLTVAVAEAPEESTLEVLRLAVADLWEIHDKLAAIAAYDDIADAIDSLVAAAVAASLTNYATRAQLAGYVPTSRTINGRALSSNISLTAANVGALPAAGYSTVSPADLGADPYVYIEFSGGMRILSYAGSGVLDIGGLYAPNGPPCHLVLSGFSSVNWPSSWYSIIDGTYDPSASNYYEIGSINGQSYVRRLFAL